MFESVYAEKTLIRNVVSAYNNESYKCTLCKKSFLRKDRVQYYRLSVHDKNTEMTHSKCKRASTGANNLRKHQKIYCKCKQCSKQFESVNSLKEHNCSSKKTKEVTNLSVTPNKEANFIILNNLEAVSIRNKQALSSKVNRLSKRKSLKIKRPAHQIKDEVTVSAICPEPKKHNTKLCKTRKLKKETLIYKHLLKNIGQVFESLPKKVKNKTCSIFTTTKI